MNTGNESTLLAILWRLRHIYPGWRFCCICTNPEAVAARDGIDAVPISRRDARLWDVDARLDRRLRTAFIAVGEELKDYIRAFRTLRKTAILVVPGTGLLTNAYGLSAWGPYNLFKWTLMAKLRRCKVLFVSVGAGPIYGAPGRLLVKSSLLLADYRSYRDDTSLSYLRQIGFRAKNDRVYPDLAFSLPETLFQRANGAGPTRVVGLGLMLYAGRYSVEDPVPETYSAYLESLAEFVKWLLEHDYDIRLLLGDGDNVVIDEFKSVLRGRVGMYDESRVVDEPMTSVDEVLAQLAETDIVVATRFHNVLLALMLNKPVVAISFHHKSTSLMDDMGLAEYCLDINRIDSDSLIDRFQEAVTHRGEIKQTVAQKVVESRSALDDQYDALFER